MELDWEALASYADDQGGEMWIGHAEVPSSKEPERMLGGFCDGGFRVVFG